VSRVSAAEARKMLQWQGVAPANMICDLAETVIALEAERDEARADLDVLSRAVGQALIAASLQAGETLSAPIPHAIVSTVTRLRAEALGQRAEIARLRAEIERPKFGDLVTPENVARLPVGTVVRWGHQCHATRTGPDVWVGYYGDYDDGGIADPEPPAHIVSIPAADAKEEE
jgi:hypothetical protein